MNCFIPPKGSGLISVICTGGVLTFGTWGFVIAVTVTLLLWGVVPLVATYMLKDKKRFQVQAGPFKAAGENTDSKTRPPGKEARRKKPSKPRGKKRKLR